MIWNFLKHGFGIIVLATFIWVTRLVILPTFVVLLLLTFAVIFYYAIFQFRRVRILNSLCPQRDKLALLAMRNKGLEHERTYRYVLNTINVQVHYTKNTINYIQFFDLYFDPVFKMRNKEYKKLLNEIKENKELFEIYKKTSKVFVKKFDKKFFLAMSLLFTFENYKSRKVAFEEYKKRQQKYAWISKTNQDFMAA